MVPQPFCAISIKINKPYEAENQQQQHQLNRLVTPRVAHEKDLGSKSAAFLAHFPVHSTPLRNINHAKAHECHGKWRIIQEKYFVLITRLPRGFINWALMFQRSNPNQSGEAALTFAVSSTLHILWSYQELRLLQDNQDWVGSWRSQHPTPLTHHIHAASREEGFDLPPPRLNLCHIFKFKGHYKSYAACSIKAPAPWSRQTQFSAYSPVLSYIRCDGART